MTSAEPSIETPQLAASPPDLRWTIPAAVALVVLAAVSLSIDAWFVVWINTWAGDGMWPRRLLKWPRVLFEWWTVVLFAVVLLRQADARQRLVAATVSLLGMLATVYGLKFLVGRARPQLGLGPFHAGFPGSSEMKLDSFPSGHTSNAIILALLIGCYWRGSRWVLWPAAVLVGLGRVAQERHYLSDTLFATAVALVWVYLPWRWFGPAVFAPIQWARVFAVGSAEQGETGAASPVETG